MTKKLAKIIFGVSVVVGNVDVTLIYHQNDIAVSTVRYSGVQYSLQYNNSIIKLFKKNGKRNYNAKNNFLRPCLESIKKEIRNLKTFNC